MDRLLFVIISFTSAHFLIAQETYRDEFSTVSYGNNDGSSVWSGDWVEFEPFDTDNDPAGGYISILGNQLDFYWIWTETIARSVNIAGATSATLSFDWETISLDANEELSIQVSDDGTTFTTLASFVGTQTGSFSQDISTFISSNTTIRFANTNANWSDTGDIVLIDDVQIEAFFSDEPPMITVTGDRHFCPNVSNAIPIVETISITDPDDLTLAQINIQISTGYQNGSDLLTLTGVHPSIIPSWDVDEGRLRLTGPATLAEFEAAVLAVVFSSTPPVIGNLREFSVVLANPLFLPETGHYYEFVPSLDIRWDDARDQAALNFFFGLQGYLATLTSAEESTFAGDQITGTGWIGASDAFGSGEGDWRWETGPEAGTSFWIGNQTGTVVPGEFAFWNAGEPNNVGAAGEDYAHITDNSIGIQNSWNDLPIGGGGGPYQALGYIVEYGGLPGDPVLQISGVTRLRVGCTVITNRNKTYRVSY